MLEFIADTQTESDPLTSRSGADRFPQLLLRSAKGQTIIDRDAMTLRLGFPIRALRLTAWCADERDIYAYDAMSGEVFKIELKNIDDR